VGDRSGIIADPMPALDLQRHFDRGATPDGALLVRELGSLLVPSGEIVACDPLVFPETPPFERRIAPGRYTIDAAIAHGRHALARLRVRDIPAVHWEIATLPGQDPTTLGPDEIFGYPVDAGTGCFMDRSTSELLLRAMDERAKSPGFISYYDDVIDALFYREGAPEGPLFTEHLPDPSDPRNVIMFESGWGDGFYASYWGLGADGEVTCLVTDFGVLEDA
jgi:hypothetical protein